MRGCFAGGAGAWAGLVPKQSQSIACNHTRLLSAEHVLVLLSVLCKACKLLQPSEGADGNRC